MGGEDVLVIRMKRKSNAAPKVSQDAPVIPIGTQVVIMRPNLWANCTGEVVKHNEDRTHRIKIQNKDGSGFWHTDAPGSQLEVDL
jgi:hypothetical protein